jgi:signal transduction histidine kinase
MALENANLYQKAPQDIIERQRAEKKWQEYTKQLQLLAQQVISIQEEERRRLSRTLHDEAGQALTALQLSLALIHTDLTSECPLLRQRRGYRIDQPHSGGTEVDGP